MRAKIVNQSSDFPVRRTGSYRHKKALDVRILCTHTSNFVQNWPSRKINKAAQKLKFSRLCSAVMLLVWHNGSMSQQKQSFSMLVSKHFAVLYINAAVTYRGSTYFQFICGSRSWRNLAGVPIPQLRKKLELILVLNLSACLRYKFTVASLVIGTQGFVQQCHW